MPSSAAVLPWLLPVAHIIFMQAARLSLRKCVGGVREPSVSRHFGLATLLRGNCGGAQFPTTG
jgi:hypothetical protein